MASQQILFAETIAGMKKAFKRKAYESDSDSDVENYGNRGHKLKKRARFVNKGQLVPSEGPSAYKEIVDYAGVRRQILYRNAPLVDDDGYEVDSEDDDERIENAMLAAAQLNPYSGIHLESILAPLTASTDLSTHPTLSKPFTSKTLTDLVSRSCSLMRKENQSLWHIRHMWTALCGDGNWMPCETMVGPNDTELYTEDQVARRLQSLKDGRGQDEKSPGTLNGEEPDASKHGSNHVGAGDGDVSMTDADGAGGATSSSVTNAKTDEPEKPDDPEKTSDEVPDVNGDAPPRVTRAKEKAAEGAEQKAADDKDGQSIADESLDDFIHPMFLPPAGAKSDANLGLPENEATDIRKMLALYVQKQEEVCRGVQKLHSGLLRAERLRSDVLHWSKAEAHSGVNRDLSDGEDWYDKEEWGLTEDLKKGQDDEEEEITTTGKKTRARR